MTEYLSYSGPVCGENQRLQPRRQGKGLTRTQPYARFREDMTLCFQSQWHEDPIAWPVSVLIAVRCPMKMDAPNLIKPILDSMQDAGVFANDRQVRHLELRTSVVWAKSGSGTIVVMVEPQSVWVSNEIEILLDRLEEL